MLFILCIASAGEPQGVWVDKCSLSVVHFLFNAHNMSRYFETECLQNYPHTNKCDWRLDWLGMPLAPCWSQCSWKVTNKKFTVPTLDIQQQKKKRLYEEKRTHHNPIEWLHFILQNMCVTRKHLDLKSPKLPTGVLHTCDYMWFLWCTNTIRKIQTQAKRHNSKGCVFCKQ